MDVNGNTLSASKILRLFGLGIPLMYLVLGLNTFQIFYISFAAIISRKLSFHLNSLVAKCVWGYLQWIFEDLHGAKVSISGASEIPDIGESALVLSNHCSLIDFYLIHCLARRKNMLGYSRYFAKDSLKYIPGFGWGMWMMGMLMIKRNWTKDQENINNYFTLYTRHQLPVWIVSFLEGTRLTPEKLEQSKAYALKHGYPVLNNVLLPRTKGFVATLSALRNSHVNFVYDITLAYHHKIKGFGTKPSLMQINYGDLNDYEFHIHIQRFPLNELPVKESLPKWVYDRFHYKDLLLDKLKTDWALRKDL